mmetsp:Transcript_18214/g.32643  ORF Transcript_18214/g.32643 Transcript_18214/m.32643 type:complete len:223 (-) Transcript_18214:2170-2838(-)
MSSLHKKGMWYSNFLEVNRLETELKKFQADGVSNPELLGTELQKAKNYFVKLMVLQKMIKQLVSLPMTLPLDLIHKVVAESELLDESAKQELMALISIVLGLPDQFKAFDSRTSHSNLQYTSIAETYKHATDTHMSSLQGVDQALFQRSAFVPKQYHIIKPRFSEPAPSKMSSSPEGESLFEVHSNPVPTHLTPLDESSLKPKKLEFTSPHLTAGSPGQLRH